MSGSKVNIPQLQSSTGFWLLVPPGWTVTGMNSGTCADCLKPKPDLVLVLPDTPADPW